MAASKRGRTQRGVAGEKSVGTKLTVEQQAAALAFASTCSDAQAAKEFGISLRTLQNYRQRLRTDEDLARLYQEHAKRLADKVEADAASTARRGLRLMNLLYEAIEKEVLEKGYQRGRLEEVKASVGMLMEAETTRNVLREHSGDDPEGREAEAPPGRAPADSPSAADSAGPVH